jgi:hypothetical protein
MTTATTLYDRDFYAWANKQAALLRAGKLDQADIEHIAEEIESMGRSEKRELVNRLTVLLAHLLKWQHQPERRGASWEVTITNQRIDLTTHIEDNPSLQSKMPEAIADAYRKARGEAYAETGLDRNAFPQTCPWSFEQMIDEGFWPTK